MNSLTQARPDALAITYLQHKDFTRALADLFNGGGIGKKRGDKVLAVLGKLGTGIDPFAGLPVTNHGETRIRHAVKYDLGDGYRLVTVQDARCCYFCFVGDHAATERWLNANSGFQPARDKDGRFTPVYVSDVDQGAWIRRETVPTRGKILDRLREELHAILLESVAPRIVAKLYGLDETASDADLDEVSAPIAEQERRRLVYDVMCLLLAGDSEGAEARIALHCGELLPAEGLPQGEFVAVQDGPELRRIAVGSAEHAEWLARFARSAPYFDWLLHMHPEQEAAVFADFDGPAQLSGVSGSGKTCIAVRRAVRLAAQIGDRRVLLVTLNRSLAGLIRRLVDVAAPDDGIRERIHVTSFFELCQQLLGELEPGSEKLYSDVTWKLGEHLDEIFREYYRCWNNNNDARILWPVHQSLMARGIWAENYVREEFDWIRTALSPGERQRYLQVERSGRKVPLIQDWRSQLVAALAGWERKMRDVGVVDYLGLTSALLPHLDNLRPQYAAAIVDEAQDFGTTELRIIRHLVAKGPNDVFLCGDIAQHVFPKHRSLSEAGIAAQGRYKSIRRNYRNTREILRAAYKVLVENLDEALVDSSDLELLDPVFANRSGARPMVLQASTLEAELAYARSFAELDLQDHPDHRCCIALAGFTLREVQLYAAKLGLPVLDGTHDPAEAGVVLSDLEQTKGYEFNVMLIVNCREGVLPPRDAPSEEAFRHGCRLYVAMTRARDELYMFSSGEVSPWLRSAAADLELDAAANVMPLDLRYLSDAPARMPEANDRERDDVRKMNGWDYVHTPRALNLSVEGLAKLEELVDGVGLRRGAHARRWRHVEGLRHDLELSERARALFGPKVQDELRRNLAGL